MLFNCHHFCSTGPAATWQQTAAAPGGLECNPSTLATSTSACYVTGHGVPLYPSSPCFHPQRQQQLWMINKQGFIFHFFMDLIYKCSSFAMSLGVFLLCLLFPNIGQYWTTAYTSCNLWCVLYIQMIDFKQVGFNSMTHCKPTCTLSVFLV